MVCRRLRTSSRRLCKSLAKNLDRTRNRPRSHLPRLTVQIPLLFTLILFISRHCTAPRLAGVGIVLAMCPARVVPLTTNRCRFCFLSSEDAEHQDEGPLGCLQSRLNRIGRWLRRTAMVLQVDVSPRLTVPWRRSKFCRMIPRFPEGPKKPF